MRRGTVKVLSFMSGLVLAAVVIGTTINKSPALRSEIENQINTVLKTTRSLIDAYKSIGSKSKAAVGLIKNEPGGRTAGEEAAAVEQAAQIEEQWDAVESSTS